MGFDIKKTGILAGACLLAIAFGGCSKGSKLTHEQSCTERYAKLNEDFEKGRYDRVRLPLDKIVTDCPGQAFVEAALYQVSESYYQVKDWPGAETQFRGFLREFPNSRQYGEKARYRLAEVLANQVRIPQRDQTTTLDAIRTFERFLSDYPDSEFADNARVEIKRLKEQLAAKEMQIARLYRRMGEPQAAAIYYRSLLKDYGNLVDRAEIVVKLVECYIDLKQFETAESYLNELTAANEGASPDGRIANAQKDLEAAKQEYTRNRKEEAEKAGNQDKL